jgi:hypothetical protein
MTIAVFWDVTPYTSVGICQCSEEFVASTFGISSALKMEAARFFEVMTTHYVPEVCNLKR